MYGATRILNSPVVMRMNCGFSSDAGGRGPEVDRVGDPDVAELAAFRNLSR